MKIFESEVHEGTLVHALGCLQIWFVKSPNSRENVPQIFVDWFPKGLALKSITSSVRTAYFSCLLRGLLSTTGASSVDINKYVTKILENACRQPSQVAIGKIIMPLKNRTSSRCILDRVLPRSIILPFITISH